MNNELPPACRSLRATQDCAAKRPSAWTCRGATLRHPSPTQQRATEYPIRLPLARPEWVNDFVGIGTKPPPNTILVRRHSHVEDRIPLRRA